MPSTAVGSQQPVPAWPPSTTTWPPDTRTEASAGSVPTSPNSSPSMASVPSGCSVARSPAVAVGRGHADQAAELVAVERPVDAVEHRHGRRLGGLGELVGQLLDLGVAVGRVERRRLHR